jgi:chemotaxis protein histidine kinase CheA
MAASQLPQLKSVPPSLGPGHVHGAHDVCPLCEQPIPHDRFDEINDRIEAREREREEAVARKLRDDFATEKSRLLETAKAEAAEQVAKARDEARKAAEAASKQQIEAVERAAQQAQEDAAAKVRSAEAAAEQVKQAAEAREQAAREEATRAVEATAQQKLAEAADAQRESEAALNAKVAEAEAGKLAAEEAGSTLQAALDKAKKDNEAKVQQLQEDAAFREVEIRAEARRAVESETQTKLTEAEEAKAAAEARASAAEQQAQSQQAAHETQLAERLKEQRDALETAKTDAVNAEKSAAFQEKLKLSSKVDELQRALEKKTAEELGEGAEIDLFEALKAEFGSDRIERVAKGQAGADIIHTVIHNGRECGKIVYDSKNHGAWRNDFVTKLASDQLAAKAAHAILASRSFPANARQLDVRNGVIIASPARVVALVLIIRQHLLQSHTLRLSNEARAQKTVELYAFITSERCTDMLRRIDTQSDELLDLQVKEKKAHDAIWKRQGELIRSVQKVRADLCNEIDIIIGTADSAGTGGE